MTLMNHFDDTVRKHTQDLARERAEKKIAAATKQGEFHAKAFADVCNAEED